MMEDKGIINIPSWEKTCLLQINDDLVWSGDAVKDK